MSWAQEKDAMDNSTGERRMSEFEDALNIYLSNETRIWRDALNDAHEDDVRKRVVEELEAMADSLEAFGVADLIQGRIAALAEDTKAGGKSENE